MRVVVVSFLACAAGCAPVGPGTGGDDGGPGDGDDAGGAAGAVLFDVARLEIDEAVDPIAGALAIAVRGDGRWALAYARTADTVFMCETLTGGEIEGGDEVEIVVVDEDAVGARRARVVDTVPGIKQLSLDLAVDPATDALIVVYAGGEPANGYCGASDLVAAIEDGDAFTTTVVATDSATGATCRYVEDPFCEIGDTVGLYPSVDVDADGTIAVAYQDLHNGFADKDLYGADLELARGATTTSLQPQTLSAEVGGGYFGALAFGPNGRVVVAHEVTAENEFPDPEGGTYTIEQGIWAVVEQADGTFTETLLASGQTTDARLAVGWTPQAGVVVAYHDRGSDELYAFVSRDEGETFVAEPVDQGGRTGRDPSLGFLADGRLMIAYGFCGPGTGDACARDQDGVKVAVKEGTTWRRQLLPGDDEDVEGKDVDLAVAGDVAAVASLDTSAGLVVVHLLTAR